MEVLVFSSFILLLIQPGISQVTLRPVTGECSDFTNTSCEQCLENVNCLWCFVGKRCMKYPVESIIPHNSTCPLRQARWGVCWVNFEFLIIAMSVVGGLILLPLVCCCCYCCCKKKLCCCCKKKSHRHDEEDVRLAKQHEERMQQRKERRAGKKAQYDEIRKKYGLIQDSDHPYSRFENE
ncbi:pituitary tumor-transforming gene 1 protein-interacting protein [Scyliorhinus canicula]|uniref:pituitary tumor-transforming gene 1 protein-interacting protein n=1 Tax=Scyliorhinus canicula TaxID=7830 RepID=UPI0018F30E5D|nr:pituitary tumor-transforming gene 1 protein-interacting protein [Scyliorhinus canicula]